MLVEWTSAGMETANMACVGKGQIREEAASQAGELELDEPSSRARMGP